MCSEVLSDSSGKKSIEYGINERSVLNDVFGFSVIGGLSHDIMHDMLEGALPYELRLFLEHVFREGYLSLNQYNDRVKSFDYGYSELADIPNDLPARCFQDKLKLRYSASEMLLIGRILPFLVADKVPENDMHFECFLKLLTILKIVMSPYIYNGIPSYLRVLIEEHHSMFVTLYPNESFIPKLHYIVHYPQQIIHQGPMIRAWTMRYEGKLKYFKGVSRNGNFKNITYSLAKWHQKWLAYHIHTSSIFTPEYIRGPIITTVPLSEEEHEIQQLFQNNIPLESSVTSMKWIKVNGLKYSTQNCYLITSTASDHHPTFSKIEKIFLLEENMKVYFVASECPVTSYDNQLLAFSFINTSQYHLLSIENLQYPWPLHKRKVLFDNSYLSPPFFFHYN